MWPRRRMVSRGSFRKSSARERVNVAMEEDVGVRTGSMWREERRKRGALVERSCGIVECSKVIGNKEVGQRRDGRARREGRRARGPASTDVRMSL